MMSDDETVLIAVQDALTKLVEVVERIHHTVGGARSRIDENISKIFIALTGESFPDRRASGRTKALDLHDVPLDVPEENLNEVFGKWIVENRNAFEKRYGSDWVAKLEVSAYKMYGAQWKRMILKIAADRRKK